MPLGIDPKVDFAFKLVFGSPEHTRVTIHFVNAVLQLPDPVVWVEILNPIQGKERAEDKLVVLDVLAKDTVGRRFNIEMQTTLPTDLTKRLTYYNCINYVRQFGEGEPYYRLRPAISICVLDRMLFAEATEFHLSFRLRCDQRDLKFSDDLEFHTLELPKFSPSGGKIRELPRVEKWLYFLQRAASMEPKELTSELSEPEFDEAVGVLEMISQSPEDRQFYEARMKFLHDEEARLIAAREEGIEKGIERGKIEGRVEGSMLGRIQTLQEVLGDSPSPIDSLLRLDESERHALLADLQTRLRSR